MKLALALLTLMLSVSTGWANNIQKVTVSELLAEANSIKFSGEVVKLEVTYATSPEQLPSDIWQLKLYSDGGKVLAVFADEKGIKFFGRLARQKQYGKRKWIYGKAVTPGEETEGVMIPDHVKFLILGSKVKRNIKGEPEVYW